MKHAYIGMQRRWNARSSLSPWYWHHFEAPSLSESGAMQRTQPVREIIFPRERERLHASPLLHEGGTWVVFIGSGAPPRVYLFGLALTLTGYVSPRERTISFFTQCRYGLVGQSELGGGVRMKPWEIFCASYV